MIKRDERVYWFGNRNSRFALYTFHIGSSSNPYMKRYCFRLPNRWTVRLHHIMRSDADEHLHDHPMGFWTLLLGSYAEVLPDPVEGSPSRTKLVMRYAGSFRWVAAEVSHRLILTRPVWTFVIAEPAHRDWGFYVGGFERENWVDHDTYFHQFSKGQS